MQQRRLQPLETRRRPAFEREAAAPPDSWVLPPWAAAGSSDGHVDHEHGHEHGREFALQGQMMAMMETLLGVRLARLKSTTTVERPEMPSADAAAAAAADAASEIRLAAQGLTDAHVEAVGQRILDEQQSLTSLDLRDNELTDGACAALAASIAVVPSLRLVDLSGNEITNAGRLTIFRALANARRRCNVLLSGEGVRDILLAVKQPADGGDVAPSPSRANMAAAAAPRRHEPPPVPTAVRETGASPALGRLQPTRADRADSPTARAEQAIAEAERALARGQPPRGSPFDEHMGEEPAEPAAQDPTNTSRRPRAAVFTHPEPEPAPAPRSPAAAAAVASALDEIRLEDRGLTTVPTRLGEDRPGRVRPRKIDLSDNELTSLAGLPQSVVQLRAANNSLADWDGIQTLPRLQRLDLSHNQLHQMGPFGICCAIRVLRLKGNSIGTLAGIEGAARTLIELDVSDNLLRSVDDVQPLTGCTRLTSVSVISALRSSRNATCLQSANLPYSLIRSHHSCLTHKHWNCPSCPTRAGTGKA
jgi:hypothetical protein